MVQHGSTWFNDSGKLQKSRLLGTWMDLVDLGAAHSPQGVDTAGKTGIYSMTRRFIDS